MRCTSGLTHCVQERVEAELQDPDRIGLAAGGGDLEELGRQLLLDRLERGPEQVRLAREVVVERAATDLGLAQDLLGRGGGEPLLARRGGGPSRSAGRGWPRCVLPAWARWDPISSLQTDSWYVECAGMTPPTKTKNPNRHRPASRPSCPGRWPELSGGPVAYVDQGDQNAPAALFVHGVLVNADLWRNVIWDVADVRRCIAPDLPAHGGTPMPSEGRGRRRPDPARPRRTARRAVRASRPRPGRRRCERHRWRRGAGVRRPLSRTDPHADAHQLRLPGQLPARALRAVRGHGGGGRARTGGGRHGGRLRVGAVGGRATGRATPPRLS